MRERVFVVLLNIHRLAREEVDAAYKYFDRYGMKPPSEFLRELRDVYTAIRMNPSIGSLIDRHHRFMKLKTYSYTVFYRDFGNGSMTVYAVAHDSRRPGYWRWRTRKP